MQGGQRPIAILLMAMGGPDSLDHVEPYLLEVRGGRPTPPDLVEEIRERYRVTGGESPDLWINRGGARKLQPKANRPGGRADPLYAGLPHPPPCIHGTSPRPLDHP